MKFCIKDFFSKCDQIRTFLRIWSHLLEKSLMEDFIFCAMKLYFRVFLSLKDGWSAENLIQYQIFGMLTNHQTSYSGTICLIWNAAPWLLIKIDITPSKLLWRCLFAKLKTMSPPHFPWKIKVTNSESSYSIFQKCIWDIAEKEDSVFEQKTDNNKKGWVI